MLNKREAAAQRPRAGPLVLLGLLQRRLFRLIPAKAETFDVSDFCAPTDYSMHRGALGPSHILPPPSFILQQVPPVE